MDRVLLFDEQPAGPAHQIAREPKHTRCLLSRTEIMSLQNSMIEQG
jgi:hypothetical protein